MAGQSEINRLERQMLSIELRYQSIVFDYQQVMNNKSKWYL